MALGGLLSGCGNVMGSSSANEPVGIGPGRDEYKKSPCACVTLPQAPPDAALFRRLGITS